MNTWVVNPNSTYTTEGLICSLAGMCDGAFSVDGMGFNKMDTPFGHSLANKANQGSPWTLKQAESALKLIRKYQRQLGGKDFVDDWIKNPVFKQEPLDPNSCKDDTNPTLDRKLISRDTTAVFQFNYNTDIVADIKTIRGVHKEKKFWAAWDSTARVWTIPVNSSSIKLIMKVAEKHNFDIEQRFKEYLEKIREKTEESHIMLELNGGRHITIAGDCIMISVDDAVILAEFENELLGGLNAK